ncbi:MAG: hypothetical protein AVDCRST_MAG53-2897 [uncultured Solirubrobacteraceae bacterium]|uniref:Uncharacterized protein n=1 Tax=uncultured Solirubrobacteraceae bacterium TaxID=1162706 RepID=A0A6J4T4K7_9ACTN|nr:MAG: hypothetical protein AVDCRST_MAG53-2897 [uncultured Solirubrobacteraceae bacterium]
MRGPSSVTAIVNSKCAAFEPVLGTDRPAVVPRADHVTPRVDHRLHRQNHASAAKKCGTFRDPDSARIGVRILKGNPSCAKPSRRFAPTRWPSSADGCSSNACPKRLEHRDLQLATAGAFPRPV